MGGVGKIQANHIDPCADQVADNGFGVGSRPQGSNNLCAALNRRFGQAHVGEGHKDHSGRYLVV